MASAGKRGRKGNKNKRKSKVFKAKDRREMLSTLEDKAAADYDDLANNAIASLEGGLHLRRYPLRSAFVSMICREPVRTTLVVCVKQMVACYLEQYKMCMKGKRYALSEQRWFEHVHDYITADLQQISHQAWTSVVKGAEEQGVHFCISEQRIVVSILAYTVHDLMADKVRDTKTAQALEVAAGTTDEMSHTLTESNVALYRYGGFALHSMVQKRRCHVSKETVKSELALLESLKVTKEQYSQIPRAIQQLNRGGLSVPSPTLLPFLRMIVEKTTSLVNDQKCTEHGRHVIKLAK